jgi:hypothetical protein
VAERLGVLSPDPAVVSYSGKRARRSVSSLSGCVQRRSRSRTADGGSRPRGGSGHRLGDKRKRRDAYSSEEEDAARGASRSRSRGRGRSRSKSHQAKRSRHSEDEEITTSSHARSAGHAADVHSRDDRSASRPSAAAATKEKSLPAEVRGTRFQHSFSPDRLPRGFQEAKTPTLVIASSGGQPMYQIGEYLLRYPLPVSS